MGAAFQGARDRTEYTEDFLVLTMTTAGRPENTYDDEDEYDLVELGEALDDESFSEVAILDMDSTEEEMGQDMDEDKQVEDKTYIGMLDNTVLPPRNVFDCHVYVDGFLRSYDSSKYRAGMCSMCLHIDTFSLIFQNCEDNQGHYFLFKTKSLQEPSGFRHEVLQKDSWTGQLGKEQQSRSM